MTPSLQEPLEGDEEDCGLGNNRDGASLSASDLDAEVRYLTAFPIPVNIEQCVPAILGKMQETRVRLQSVH